MKRLTLLFIVAIVGVSFTAFASSPATGTTKRLALIVEGLHSCKGVVLLAATGGEKPIYLMAEIADDTAKTATFTIEEMTADTLSLSIFHDENANYQLDMVDGRPAEGCIRCVATLPDADNTRRITLTYPQN